MAGKVPATQQKPRIADRLASARRGRFIGRIAELELFRSALIADEPPFSVLILHGPGGVGKTTLLGAFATIADECGRPVVRIDGRNIEPSPPGFVAALRRALRIEDGSMAELVAGWPPGAVLLIDTYETMAPLDGWLRETLLPQLPAETVVVIAGRQPPAPAWRTDLDWSQLTRVARLGNFQPEESQTYLAARGIPAARHAEALASSHGHPLALALAADALSRGDRLAGFGAKAEPDVVRILLERLAQEAPSQRHRRALEICVLAWATTEDLLAEVMDQADVHNLFSWLRGLSFVEQGPFGIFPHDLARDVLDADLRWRSPDDHRTLCVRLANCLHDRFHLANGFEQQRVWFDLLYLHRNNPFFKPYFDWSAFGTAYAEPATRDDHEAIVSIVLRHHGAGAARIARHWLNRQPEAFLIYRSFDGEVFGFMAQLVVHDATAEDIAVDPAVPAALEFARRHGPLREGEEIVYLRFFMSREAGQAVSPAINLTAINCSIYWLTHPKMAWNFIAIDDPDFFTPHFTSIHIWRSPEADFVVDGRRFGVFAHDWRVEPPAAWMNIKAELAAVSEPAPRLPQPPTTQMILSEAEFAEATRQALRDFTSHDRLAANPLIRSRVVRDALNGGAPSDALKRLLRDAVATLAASPRYLKFHRAVWHTYIEPAPSQERAAELLDLPFNTYRYHLAKGIERVVEWLWQRETHGANR